MFCYNNLMKITVLVENNSRIDRYLVAEPALSLLIESDDKKILFDTGYSDIFLQNAKNLNIDLNNLTDVVLSHGHDDHSGGLRFFNPKNNKILFTAHPRIFDEKCDPDGTQYGCPLTKEELENKFRLNLTSSVFKIADNLYFLGEIENNTSNDKDDSALVYVYNKKLFIITGCSHSGIENIIKHAKNVTGIQEIYGILGGMHLINKSESELRDLGEYLQSEGVEYLAPCHCCDLKSKITLAKYLPVQEICTGDVIKFE